MACGLHITTKKISWQALNQGVKSNVGVGIDDKESV